MQGKIIKGIAGFYYVHVNGKGIYESKAKGIFRKENIKPLVGDDVKIEITDAENFKGNIVEILPRRSELIRPAVANIDQLVIIASAAVPVTDPFLIDRVAAIAALIMEHRGKENEKKFMAARITAAAALLIGFVNAFFL